MMKAHILRTDSPADLAKSLEIAKERLASDDVVAIPTETVYGLAARVDSRVGIEKIFKIKQRPFFDPLIVHCDSVDSARGLASEWPAAAQLLAQKYWPGPLTLVVKKASTVSDLITSGLETVGVRVPKHPLTLDLLKQLGVPLAAPSANLFGHTSPTEAKHVVQEFIDCDLMVLDGGSCKIGIESTIVQIFADNRLSLLRKGMLSQKELQHFLAQNQMNCDWVESDKVQSPGQMQHHYMPSVPLILIDAQNWQTDRDQAARLDREKHLLKFLEQKWQSLPNEVEGVKIRHPQLPIEKIEYLILGDNPSLAARNLYGSLRRCAAKGPQIIVCEYAHLNSLAWEAITDRLCKAATFTIGSKGLA